MLAFFNRFSNSWVMKGFLSLLVVAFSVWGIKDVFHPKISTAVVSAGSHDIEPRDFKRIFQAYVKQVSQQSQGAQTLTAHDAVAQGIDVQLLQQVADTSAMAEFIRKLGIIPSDTLVMDELKKQPMFFDRVTGKFDQQSYVQTLAENDLTPEQFQTSIRDDLAQNLLAASLAAGLKQPIAYSAVVASYELEGRTLSYFLLDPHNVQPPTLPTDQQLQAYIAAQHIRLPETRVLSFVRFSAKTLAPSLTPDPAQLQKMFDFRKDSLSVPEKRSVVQIPAKDTATAQAIAAKLQSGQAPDAVAKSFGVQAITYTDTPKSAVADPKVADTAFQLQNGQVSGPVQTSLSGLAVIKVTSLTPAKPASFADVKPQLEEQARQEMATQKVYAAVQKYNDTHAGGSGLADSAKAAGGAVEQAGPVAANGSDLTGKPNPALTQKLLQEAFALSQGAETDLDTDGKGEYFAVRVDKVIPAAAPTVDQLRPILTQYWMRDEMLKRLHAKADELTAKIKKGESFEAAAGEVHAQVGHVVAATRMALSQNQQWGQELVGKLFAAKAGDIITGQTAQIPVMVARLDTISPPPLADAAKFIQGQRSRAAVQTFNDMGELARGAARTAIKPETDIDRARTAIGASSDDAPKAARGAKPASGAKPAA